MIRHHKQIRLGATPSSDGSCLFCVWAPFASNVSLVIVSPLEREVRMTRDTEGYHTAVVEGVSVGTRYWYSLDGRVQRPDPASRYQPLGVHGPSEVVPAVYVWDDSHWAGIPLDQYIIYELHVGTFTPEGTFDAVIPRLESLAALGVTAVEFMPIAQFPGSRNWGYDGVGIFAAQNSYGGPLAFKRLVEACHNHGLAVVLDVVYNHLGPEGNYLHDFGPYFTDRYKTPWGKSLNFDGPHSDHVRRYFLDNALYWITDCCVDALRLDATQAMADMSAFTVLEELVATVHHQREALNRKIYLMAETDRSDDRLIRPKDAGGVGMDAQWSDEPHHVLHAMLTGETFSYYRGYGEISQMAQALRHGFVFAGQYSPVHERRHGTFRSDLPAKRFVICAQNHDHVGNRMNGDRFSRLLTFDTQKLAAAMILLSPYLPLLFMGEEYSEPNPFLFFCDFGDASLREAVRVGRASEFAAFHTQGAAPDPNLNETFLASKLDYAQRSSGIHRVMLDYYTELIRLRKSLRAFQELDKDRMEVFAFERQRVIFMRRWADDSDICVLFNIADKTITLTAPIPAGEWTCILASTDARWSSNAETSSRLEQSTIEPGSSAELSLPPVSVLVFQRQAPAN